jgi:hypothetical protein
MTAIVIGPKTTRRALAGIVSRAFRAALKLAPVLVGGAVVSIYTKGRYLSRDLDFVSYSSKKEIKPVMEGLGFVQDGMCWCHPDSELLVQFVNPPVLIGNKHVKTPDRMKTAAGVFNILSPLDSACDRLSAYLHWKDRQGLDQCADIVIEQNVSIPEIAKWLDGEDASAEKKRLTLSSLKRAVAARRPQRKRPRSRR